MYCPKQISLPNFGKSSTAFGGGLGAGKRKTARPICTKRSIHVVLRASVARGRWSLLHPENARHVHRVLRKYSKRFEVKVYDYVNVGNHLHLSLRAKTKVGFRNFLRVVAGQIAQRITGAWHGTGRRVQFWDLSAFSRLVEWGRAYRALERYFRKNLAEAAPRRSFSNLHSLNPLRKSPAR